MAVKNLLQCHFAVFEGETDKDWKIDNIGVLKMVAASLTWRNASFGFTLNQYPLGNGGWATAVILTKISREKSSLCVTVCGASRRLCMNISNGKGKRKPSAFFP